MNLSAACPLCPPSSNPQTVGAPPPSGPQVMSLIAYLMEKKQNFGPHLIIVPNAGEATAAGG